MVHKVWRRLKKIVHLFFVKLSIRHVHGPKSIQYKQDEVVVVCLVRNGSYFMESFINYYSSLGVKHIVFLDNGSADETIALAQKYQNVTILSSNAVVSDKIYVETYFRQYLAERFCKDRWCLWVDMDEFFDYPFSNVVNLSAFIKYLNTYSYTAVITQMLDMFSDLPLNRLKDEFTQNSYQFYDISNIAKEDYFSEGVGNASRKNSLLNNGIKFYRNGIRQTIFGTANWLTKHQLFFVKDIRLLDPHRVINAKCADISAVVLHYKFAGNFLKTASQYAVEKFCVPAEYSAIVSECSTNPDLCLKLDTARKLDSIEDLIENKFLVVSEQYLKWVHQDRLINAAH